jgi:hypothetical protein
MRCEDYVEQLTRALEHPDRIYVRAEKDGRWGSYKLSDVPATTAIAYIRRVLSDAKVSAQMRPEE